MSEATNTLKNVARLECAARMGELPQTVFPLTGEPCYAVPSGHLHIGTLFPWTARRGDLPIPFGVVRYNEEFLPSDIASQLLIRVRLAPAVEIVIAPAAPESTVPIQFAGIPLGNFGEAYPLDVLVPVRALRPLIESLLYGGQQMAQGEGPHSMTALPA